MTSVIGRIFLNGAMYTAGSSVVMEYSIWSGPIRWYFSIRCNHAVTNAHIAPSLGRNLAACRARTVASCTATATAPLIKPQTVFENGRSQFDLRLSKPFRVGPRIRLQANFDVYNVINANTILV